MKFAMKTLVAVLLIACCLASQRAQAGETAPSCGDLRDKNNQLLCNTKAFRAWLSAGKHDSNLDSTCLDDLVELPKKCDLTEELEERLKLSEKHMNRKLLKQLKRLINGPVIELYFEEHPTEKLHLGYSDEGKCCRSMFDFPIRNITDNLIGEHINNYLEGNEKDPEKVPFDQMVTAVQRVLRDHLFIPCGRYLHVMDDLLFGQLQGAVSKFMQNNWDFLSKQSQVFRRAVFRYQFCSSPKFGAREFDRDYDFYQQQNVQGDYEDWDNEYKSGDHSE